MRDATSDEKNNEIRNLEERNAFLEREVERLECHANTLYSYAMPVGLCPKCKDYILLEGYVCFGCGYDRSDKDDGDEI